MRYTFHHEDHLRDAERVIGEHPDGTVQRWFVRLRAAPVKRSTHNDHAATQRMPRFDHDPPRA